MGKTTDPQAGFPPRLDDDGDVTEAALDAAHAALERACEILEERGYEMPLIFDEVEQDQNGLHYVTERYGNLVVDGADGWTAEAWVDDHPDIPADQYGWTWTVRYAGPETAEIDEAEIEALVYGSIDGCTAEAGELIEAVAHVIADGVSGLADETAHWGDDKDEDDEDDYIWTI